MGRPLSSSFTAARVSSNEPGDSLPGRAQPIQLLIACRDFHSVYFIVPHSHQQRGHGFRVSGLGFRVSGLGFRVSDLGLGFRVSGLGFRV